MHKLLSFFFGSAVWVWHGIRRNVKNNPLEPDPKTVETEKLLNSLAFASGSPTVIQNQAIQFQSVFLLNTLCPLSERDAIISICWTKQKNSTDFSKPNDRNPFFCLR